MDDDRLEQIRAKLKPGAHHRSELEWLIGEVERLRAEVSRLEDAVSEGKATGRDAAEDDER